MNPDIETNHNGEEIVVINPHIWKKSGLSRPDFLKRIRNMRAIRIGEINCSQVSTGFPVFSYFPRSLESWGLLERFHKLVNEGDFSVFDERTDDFIIAIVIRPSLGHWLLNTKITTFQRQILNWLAAWFTFHSDPPDKKTTQLPPGVLEQVESIRRTHYSPRFSYDKIWNRSNPQEPFEFLKHYQDVTKELTGAASPEILKLRDCELEGVDLESWGLSGGQYGNWMGFDFSYRFIRICDGDWERYVLRGEVSNDDRAESDEALRQKWFHTLELYPTRRSHIFGIFGAEVQMGFVYIFKGEELGRYKIGFTTNENSFARKGSLQTGSAERLIPIGYFRAASDKTEKTVQKFFEAKRVRPGGEWFALTEEDIANLLNEEWRIRNNIF